jgi:hypothetical protein
MPGYGFSATGQHVLKNAERFSASCYTARMSEPRAQPPCGLYRTKRPVGGVPAGRLVYFHNHGDPGAGIYLPAGWRGNRARFQPQGSTVSLEEAEESLVPLAPEGFYRVAEAFHCCDRKCRLFEADTLVQLGYDGEANALLFTPELVRGALALPEMGTRIDETRLGRLRPLKVHVADEGEGEEIH